MDFITGELKRFVAERDSFVPSAADKMRTYTASPEYLVYTTSFHHDHSVKGLVNTLDYPAGTRFIDVGCCSGFTGLTLAQRGYPVAFHDYEGLGLEFVRWFGNEHGLDVTVIPYGQDLPQMYDVAIALDVLEHSGNHLGFIRWISQMAGRVIICYPLMPFRPPHEAVLDEWVDDKAICQIVGERYKLLKSYLSSSADRRFLIWE